MTRGAGTPPLVTVPWWLLARSLNVECGHRSHQEARRTPTRCNISPLATLPSAMTGTYRPLARPLNVGAVSKYPRGARDAIRRYNFPFPAYARPAGAREACPSRDFYPFRLPQGRIPAERADLIWGRRFDLTWARLRIFGNIYSHTDCCEVFCV